MIRKALFWLHLGSGVVTGLVVAMMSLTGVLLTYELQFIAFADRAFYAAPPAGASRAPVSGILGAAESANVDAQRVTFYNNPEAPVLVAGGRREPSVFVNPYTAEVLGEPSPGIRSVMSTIMGWHRWFNLAGESRTTARLVTGISNLAFLFLIITGMYLWLPKVFKWPLLRPRLWFSKSYKNMKERDFNWHHIFGIWSAVPLIVVVATATVFGFRWASDLVYIAAGEEPPKRSGSSSSAEVIEQMPIANPAPLDTLLVSAANHTDAWRTLRLTVPDAADRQVSVEVDRGNGRQPQLRDTLHFDAQTGELIAIAKLSDRTPGAQARTWVRFLHTGEIFGLVGQTIAGIVSFTSLFMVWTGFTLAWRRIISPLLGRRNQRPQRSTV